MRQIALLLLTIAVAHASVTVTKTSDDGPQPSTMEIEVQLPGSTKTARIPLTRTDAFENVPMTVMENGVSRTFSAHQLHHASHSHYRDIASKSVISVRHVNGKRQISGHVTHEGTSYFLEPVGDSEHRVTKNVMNPVAEQIDRKKVLTQIRRKRQLPGLPTTNVIEIQLLLDHTVWNAFKLIYTDDSTAETELHYYYTHILNGLDTVYRNIGTPSISVKCIGLKLSKTQVDSTWMPPNTAPDATEASAILGYIRAYTVKTYPAGSKMPDHVMGFTRLDIKVGDNKAVCGMAFMNGTCKDLRQSISEDQGLHSWGTASHELAHNLGSEHDEERNPCKSDNKFIMSPASGFYSLSDVPNSYRLSSCTIAYINDYINSLETNCLRTSQGSAEPTMSANVREGTRLTLDQVCRLSYPQSSGKFYLSDDASANPATICAKIYCYPTADSSSGVSTGGLRAPIGTSCGNKKSCNWNGQCTADSTAKDANESCFWGDSWGDQCPGWTNYIKYLRDNSKTADAESYCGQARAGCCASLKTLCPA